MIIHDISRSKLVRYFCGTSIPAMLMISNEISWWDIFVVQVIQVMQLNKVMQVRLAHLWPDFRVICTKKYTLFPITVNVILLFVRRLKTEIVIDNVRKKTLKYMYDTCPCWKQTMLYLCQGCRRFLTISDPRWDQPIKWYIHILWPLGG